LKILRRYLFRETFAAWAAVTLVLLVILLGTQLADVLGEAAANRLPREAVLEVIGLSMLTYLPVLVPIAFLLGVLLALARLYRDSEMAAMMACGVGHGSVYRAILPMVIVLTAALAWLALVGAPWAYAQIVDLQMRAARGASLSGLEAGRFVSLRNTVLYAEEVTPEGELRRLFVQRTRDDKVEVVVAERGRRVATDDGRQMFVLHDGRRYEGTPGQADFRLIEFAEHGIPIVFDDDGAGDEDIEAVPTEALWQVRDAEAVAELQWRASVPVALLVLAFLSVPLARTQPRQGRYARVVVGVLLYIVYSNLLAAARLWVERGEVPLWLGLVALLMLGWQAGRLRPRPPGPPLPKEVARA
jgi:lipopolysaccharide export system permease protein